jgi:hypothetical protein
MDARVSSAVIGGFCWVPRCQKKLTLVAYDFCAVRAKQNSGMIHSFWERFAEYRKLLLQIPIVNG